MSNRNANNNYNTTLRSSNNIQKTNNGEASKSYLAFWGSRQILVVNSKSVHVIAFIKRKIKDYFVTIIKKELRMRASDLRHCFSWDLGATFLFSGGQFSYEQREQYLLHRGIMSIKCENTCKV